MDESIEKHLVDKLNDKLQRNSRVRFHGRFEKLVHLLEDVILVSSPADRSSIRKELYCLNNVYEECQMLSKKTKIETVLSPSVLPSILQISPTLDKIEQELHKIKKTVPSSCPLPRKTEAPRESSRHVDPSRVYGLENQVVSMERRLLQPGKSSEPFNAITVTGIRGVGKTTLAQLVFNKETVKARFLPRIWVSMSRQPGGAENSREAIAKKLLTLLGVNKDTIQSIESKGIRGLLYALHLQLIGKRYLIVLDDAWDRDEWYEVLGSAPGDAKEWGGRLAYGLPKGYGGSVIITSRWEEVGNVMVGSKNVIRLQPLEDHESCWRIFKDEVERDGVTLSVEHMEKLRPEIEKKSSGLPLAAKVMGQILFQKLKTEAMGKQDHHRIDDA